MQKFVPLNILCILVISAPFILLSCQEPQPKPGFNDCTGNCKVIIGRVRLENSNTPVSGKIFEISQYVGHMFQPSVFVGNVSTGTNGNFIFNLNLDSFNNEGLWIKSDEEFAMVSSINNTPTSRKDFSYHIRVDSMFPDTHFIDITLRNLATVQCIVPSSPENFTTLDLDFGTNVNASSSMKRGESSKTFYVVADGTKKGRVKYHYYDQNIPTKDWFDIPSLAKGENFQVILNP